MDSETHYDDGAPMGMQHAVVDPTTGVFGALAVAMAVVDDLADPHPAAVVDVDVRRAEQHRLGGEEGRFQPFRHVEGVEGRQRFQPAGIGRG